METSPMLPSYAGREEVRASLDSEPSARMDGQIDQVLAAASRDVEQLCHRVFYPYLATRYFGWLDRQMGDDRRLWLDADELVSLTVLAGPGGSITDYFLEPSSGPPYTHIELDLSSDAYFGGGDTPQRAISAVGLWGYRNDEVTAGALAYAVANNVDTGIDVTNSAAIGVGELVRCDSERMIVMGRRQLATGQTLGAPITASRADETVTVVSAAGLHVGETILLDAERMLIDDIAGNTLVVKRAQLGSTLAAHTGSVIYAPRTLVVTRGALGTTAAAHSAVTPLSRHNPPSLVRELVVGQSIDTLQQRSSGYARTVGSGDNARAASGRALHELRERVYAAHGRKVRMRAV